MNKPQLIAISAALLAPAILSADKISLAVSGGVFFPVNSEIQNLFGKSILKVGVSPSGHAPGSNWKVAADISAISAEKDGNKFFVAPVLAVLERSFGSTTDQYRPYVLFGGGIAYYDYAITRSSTRFSNKTFGAAGLAEVGVNFDKVWRLSASYTGAQKRDDFDFSGFTIELHYTFARL
ncbi:MAG: outer membrane beta-barrel protein [Armatimonadetes bacterium]|nr:outer membrane beta-barrel protein [Armatimonadota bacterium]